MDVNLDKLGEYMDKEFDEPKDDFGLCEDCGKAKATNRSAKYPEAPKYRCTGCWIKSMD